MFHASPHPANSRFPGNHVGDAAVIYVVEADAQMRQAFKRALEPAGYEVITAASGGELLVNYDIERIGCLLLDLHVPDMTGLELKRRLRMQGCRRPYIVVSGAADVRSAVAALQSGAFDFIEKPFAKQCLLDSVLRAVDQHRAWKNVQAFLDVLTDRERQILRQVIAGRATKEIARELDLSPRTIDVHRGNILRKTSMGSFTQLAHILACHEAHQLS